MKINKSLNIIKNIVINWIKAKLDFYKNNMESIWIIYIINLPHSIISRKNGQLWEISNFLCR